MGDFVIRRTTDDRLTEGNGQQTSRNTTDKQAPPRGGPSALGSPKEHLPQPENDKNQACAAQRSWQMRSQKRAPQKRSDQCKRIDGRRLASIADGKEDRVLSLQHFQSQFTI